MSRPESPVPDPPESPSTPRSLQKFHQHAFGECNGTPNMNYQSYAPSQSQTPQSFSYPTHTQSQDSNQIPSYPYPNWTSPMGSMDMNHPQQQQQQQARDSASSLLSQQSDPSQQAFQMQSHHHLLHHSHHHHQLQQQPQSPMQQQSNSSLGAGGANSGIHGAGIPVNSPYLPPSTTLAAPLPNDAYQNSYYYNPASNGGSSSGAHMMASQTADSRSNHWSPHDLAMHQQHQQGRHYSTAGDMSDSSSYDQSKNASYSGGEISDSYEDNAKPSDRIYGGGRKKIEIKHIEPKLKRQITFSKRKSGLMKKVGELVELTGTEALVILVSETGNPHTFATQSFIKLIAEGDNAKLQNYLNSSMDRRKSRRSKK